MAETKRYYYLKLKENFFEREEVKVIRGMEKGDSYICMLLEMYLRSLKRDGALMMTDKVPFSLKTLSSVLGKPVADVEEAFALFTELGLIDVMEDGTIFMSTIQDFIGQSSSEADRKRAYRAKVEKQNEEVGQCPDKCPPEIEIETEKKKEKKPKREKGTNISFESFWDCYNKQVGKSSAQSSWKRLSPSDKEAIAIHLPRYIEATPTIQYRKNPTTYLNSRAWEDRLLPTPPSSPPPKQNTLPPDKRAEIERLLASKRGGASYGLS